MKCKIQFPHGIEKEIFDEGKEPIIIHVAKWNEKALSIYQHMGFIIIKTEIIR